MTHEQKLSMNKPKLCWWTQVLKLPQTFHSCSIILSYTFDSSTMFIPKLSFLKLTSDYCVLLKDSKYCFDDLWTQCRFSKCLCSFGHDRWPDQDRWAGSNMSFLSRPRQEGWWDKVSQLRYEGEVSRFSFSPWDILGGKFSSSLFQWKKNPAFWVAPKDDSCQGIMFSQGLHWHGLGQLFGKPFTSQLERPFTQSSP